MDGTNDMADSNGGFSTHVQEQLRQAAMNVPTAHARGSHSHPRRGHGNRIHINETYHQPPMASYHNGPYYPRQPAPPSWKYQAITNMTDQNAFPPLGAARPQMTVLNQQPLQSGMNQSSPFSLHSQPQAQLQPQLQPQLQQLPPPPSHFPPQPEPNTRREVQQRGRGRSYRGRGNHHSFSNSNNKEHQQHVQSQTPQIYGPNDFRRSAPAHRRLYTPGAHPPFVSVEEQRALQRKIMDQSDFLNHLARQVLQHQLSNEEQREKERFRKELEVIAQAVIGSMISSRTTVQLKPEHVQLKLYGSLGSGFAVAGSDMDLLLSFPRNEGPLGDIEIESRRVLEKSLLDAGIGARLLTNTRVPILRVCQTPGPELLRNLREYRLKWEQSLNGDEPPSPQPVVDEGFGPLPDLTDLQMVAAEAALADLDASACEVPLPASPTLEHAKLEYVGDCGIQCDINFSNYVALHNTSLLKAYGRCDPRVRQVGVFVKLWAKARDINTPYRGTLSSYGYILMVLHYLMNIADPPLIPNLQELAKQRDFQQGKTDINSVDGFDVRFIRDHAEIQAVLGQMPRNHESVGSLLRGFFWYFADGRGFHWNNQVISIRSSGGGQLLKRSKGWTEAKWSSENSNVRLRYLLAIEDPFELEHNVARTVGHNGLVAIRDEFRKAWNTIENIKFDHESRMWLKVVDGEERVVKGDEMMATVDNRGDLLRKDQNYHRQKVKQMRLELEVKEKTLQQQQQQQQLDVDQQVGSGKDAETETGVAMAVGAGVGAGAAPDKAS